VPVDRPRSKMPALELPRWLVLTKRYLAGDVRAGVRAASSVRRWRARYYPEKGARR
jgi:hypothetical protein